MSEALEDRINRIVRELFDTHLDLLALLLAESGVPGEEQIARLDALYQTMQAIKFAATLFDGGRRVPFELSEDKAELTLNSELIERISDDEVVSTLARPMASILSVSGLSVSLALKTRDEQTVKGLTTKVVRKLDIAPVRAVDVPSYVDRKVSVFARRLHRIAKELGQENAFEIQPSEEVRDALRGSAGWPEWSDLSDIPMLQVAVTGLASSLSDSPWASHTELFVELLWDSLGLTPHSFLRHAGRALRTGNVAPLEGALNAVFVAVQEQETWLSTELDKWPVFSDIFAAWSDLAHNERRAFGVTLHDVPPKSVSVTQAARTAFGLDQPKTLPWEVPVVCWTVREQTALRDLFVGLARTLPIPDADEYPTLSALGVGEPLGFEEQPPNLGVHVAPLDSELVAMGLKEIQTASQAVISRLCEQFEALGEETQAQIVARVRLAYDEFFPAFKEVWERHFYEMENQPLTEQFFQLVTEVQTVLTVPMIFDPFLKPSQDDPAPFPTLTLVAAVQNTDPGVQTPFYVPLSALNSTHQGVPIRVRAVRVSTTNGCTWLCDRTLALNKLQGQAVDLLTRAVHGDCMRFALFT